MPLRAKLQRKQGPDNVIPLNPKMEVRNFELPGRGPDGLVISPSTLPPSRLTSILLKCSRSARKAAFSRHLVRGRRRRGDGRRIQAGLGTTKTRIYPKVSTMSNCQFIQASETEGLQILAAIPLEVKSLVGKVA